MWPCVWVLVPGTYLVLAISLCYISGKKIKTLFLSKKMYFFEIHDISYLFGINARNYYYKSIGILNTCFYTCSSSGHLLHIIPPQDWAQHLLTSSTRKNITGLCQEAGRGSTISNLGEKWAQDCPHKVGTFFCFSSRQGEQYWNILKSSKIQNLWFLSWNLAECRTFL